VSGRVPAPLVFVASAFSQYLGAGLAVSLFSLMPSTTVAWWELCCWGSCPAAGRSSGSRWSRWPLPWPARTAARHALRSA